MTKVTDPQKMYFKIGEVSELSGVKPHVLRYWENEFKVAKPMRSRAQQRVYKRSDVEKILLIKKLLYEDKYSIAGAKKRLREIIRQNKNDAKVEADNQVNDSEDAKVEQTAFSFTDEKVKNNLREVMTMLSNLKKSLD